MASSIVELREALRLDLRDIDASGYRWADADLTRAIDRAVADYQRAAPLEAREEVPTLPGSRALSLAGIAGLLWVEAVEYPLGEDPPCLVPFHYLGNTLTLRSPAVPDGSPAALHLCLAHTVDALACTVPAADTGLVLLGAAGFAHLEMASHTINRITTSSWAPKHFRDLAREELREFHRALAKREARTVGRGQSVVAFQGYEV